jgi:hypothetical protein
MVPARKTTDQIFPYLPIRGNWSAFWAANFFNKTAPACDEQNKVFTLY